MFEVTVEHTFAAGHALRGYRGKCENTHGHNYRVRLTLRGRDLNSTGLLYDFVELKGALRQVADRVDHQFLNDLAPFDLLNPSAENLAKYFYQEIDGRLAKQRPGNGVPENNVKVAAVTVWETDTTTATYTPE